MCRESETSMRRSRTLRNRILMPMTRRLRRLLLLRPIPLRSRRNRKMDMSKDTVWNKYASGHLDTWYHSYDFDRWAAWSNIYGSDPRGDPRYTRYCPDHTCQHGM